MAVEVDQRVRIAAPPERVWRALTELDDLRRWLFPSADADVREGGFWRFTFPHWPSARGLHHPALNFGGPIVELEPGRVLAVQFEPPYWGVLRFEVSARGDGAELRMTQRGFEGNEDWLADFRGGWGSFSDRLALLCEIGEVATAAGHRGDARGRAHARAGRAPGALRSSRSVDLPGGPTGTPTAGAITLVLPGAEAAPATAAPRGSLDALCLALPPSADLAAARASLERSLPRRGWTAAGRCARRRPGASRAGCELRCRIARRSTPPIPSPSCAPSSARSARRADSRRRLLRSRRRVRARRRAAPASARHAARAPPAGAVARFWRLRLAATACSLPTGKATAGRPAATAARAPGRSPGTGASSGWSCASIRPWRAWSPHDRRLGDNAQGALGDRVHTQPAELAAVARDASHVIGAPRALDLPRDGGARRHRRADRPRARLPIVARGGGTSLTGATVPTRGGS